MLKSCYFLEFYGKDQKRALFWLFSEKELPAHPLAGMPCKRNDISIILGANFRSRMEKVIISTDFMFWMRNSWKSMEIMNFLTFSTLERKLHPKIFDIPLLLYGIPATGGAGGTVQMQKVVISGNYMEKSRAYNFSCFSAKRVPWQECLVNVMIFQSFWEPTFAPELEK